MYGVDVISGNEVFRFQTSSNIQSKIELIEQFPIKLEAESKDYVNIDQEKYAFTSLNVSDYSFGSEYTVKSEYSSKSKYQKIDIIEVDEHTFIEFDVVPKIGFTRKF